MINNKIIKTIALSTISCFLLSNTAFAKNLIKKDESVYVILNTDGSKKEVIVSDWLHSDIPNTEIKDKSILNSIVNVKGDEKPVISNDNLIWKSSSNDIFYQGTTNKELPIGVNISYYLDGNKISADKIAGKSGKIKIDIEFKNKDSHVKNINGKNKTIYTPFTVIAAINLPIDNFKNVKVNSGELISDGNNQVITFVSILGLKESLGVDTDLIDIPEKLTVEADCTDFKLSPIMISATPKMIDISKLEGANNIKDLIDGISKIKDATYKLSEGTGKIVSGAKELSDNMSKLILGLEKLNTSSNQIYEGAQKLSKGSEDALLGAKKLSEGTLALSKGSEKLSSGAVQYADGAEQFASSSKKFADGAVAISNGTLELSQKTGELYEGLNQLVLSTEQIKSGEKQVFEGASKSLEVITKLKEAKIKENNSIELLIKGIDGIENVVSLLSSIPLAKDIEDKITQGLETQKSYLKQLLNSGNEYVAALTELEKGILSIKNGTENLNTALSNLQEGQKKAATGAYLISKGGETLKSHALELQKGSSALTEGANKLSQSGKTLSEGLKQIGPGTLSIAEGSQKLCDGLSSLKDGSDKLKEGTYDFSKGMNDAYIGSVKLANGANTLSNGAKLLDENMKKFKEEGIDKAATDINNKFGNIDDVLKAKDEVINFSKEYKTFSGIGEDMEGSVKFIMRTEEIKAVEIQKEKVEVQKNDNTNFLEWLKNIFKHLFSK